MKNYNLGDAVYLYNPSRKKGVSPKLQSFWEGPYLIIEKLSDLVYKIQSAPSAKTRIIHHDRLKPCFEKVDSWLKNETLPVNDDALVKQPLSNPDISIDFQPTNQTSFEPEELPVVESQTPEDIPQTTRSGRVTKPPKHLLQYYSF